MEYIEGFVVLWLQYLHQITPFDGSRLIFGGFKIVVDE